MLQVNRSTKRMAKITTKSVQTWQTPKLKKGQLRKITYVKRWHYLYGEFVDTSVVRSLWLPSNTHLSQRVVQLTILWFLKTCSQAVNLERICVFHQFYSRQLDFTTSFYTWNALHLFFRQKTFYAQKLFHGKYWQQGGFYSGTFFHQQSVAQNKKPKTSGYTALQNTWEGGDESEDRDTTAAAVEPCHTSTLSCRPVSLEWHDLLLNHPVTTVIQLRSTSMWSHRPPSLQQKTTTATTPAPAPAPPPPPSTTPPPPPPQQQPQQQQGTNNHWGPVLLLCFYLILQTKTGAPCVVLTPRRLEQPFYKDHFTRWCWILWPLANKMTE